MNSQYPVLCTGMNGKWVFGGMIPQLYHTFSGSPTAEQKKPRTVGGVLHGVGRTGSIYLQKFSILRPGAVLLSTTGDPSNLMPEKVCGSDCRIDLFVFVASGEFSDEQKTDL